MISTLRALAQGARSLLMCRRGPRRRNRKVSGYVPHAETFVDDQADILTLPAAKSGVADSRKEIGDRARCGPLRSGVGNRRVGPHPAPDGDLPHAPAAVFLLTASNTLSTFEIAIAHLLVTMRPAFVRALL